MSPLGINLMIKQDPEESNVRASGIILLKKKPQFVWGEVLEVGDIDEDINVGDRVYYANVDVYRETEGKLKEETGVQLVSIKNIFYWEQ